MFVAVVPPEDVLDDLEETLAPRREAAPFRWTSRETWHLTLAFMAEVPERKLDELVERLERAARRRRPMTLALAGAGAFPNASRAKVLYAAVEGGPDDLEELRRSAVGARAAANKAGAAAGGDRFTPHVTLARLRRPLEATRWLRALSGYRSRDFTVDELVLVESHLGEGPRNRPRYVVVDAFAVGGAAQPPDAPGPDRGPSPVRDRGFGT